MKALSSNLLVEADSHADSLIVPHADISPAFVVNNDWIRE